MSADRTIGNYVLGPVIGRGGMSEVYAAEHRFLGDRVAIKLLRSQLAGEAAATAAFVAEATRTRAIDHPGVVRVIDFGSDGDAFYLVMERLDGESLAGRLSRAGRLDEPEARRIGAAIADALAAAHDRGIVHRDLKPANIVLVAGEPVVIDFGIAREIARAATGSRLGTVAYMAPEQLTGGLVAPCVDVWALGVVLYESLAGRLPFEGFDEGRAPQLFEAPPPLGALVPVSAALEALVAGCLARDPSRRPPSMADVARALRDPASEQRFTEPLPPLLEYGAAADHDPAALDRGAAEAAPADHAARDAAAPAAEVRAAVAAEAVPALDADASESLANAIAFERPTRRHDRARRPRGRIFAAIAVLAGAGGGIGWALYARSAATDAPAVSSTAPTTAAPPAPATAPPAPTTAPPSAPATASPTAPTTASPTAPATDAPTAPTTTPPPAPTTAAPIAPATAPTTPPAAVPTQPAGVVSVEVRSTPAGASIMVGGKRVGTTPATISVALPAAILVTRSGYRPARVRAVRAGPIDVRLAPSRPARPARPAAGETLD